MAQMMGKIHQAVSVITFQQTHNMRLIWDCTADKHQNDMLSGG
ncbi:hypothetical protein [uncultured Desulfobacter sp.]|nr:hypothetical protein [uncultured Desulfobacter sp.]